MKINKNHPLIAKFVKQEYEKARKLANRPEEPKDKEFSEQLEWLKDELAFDIEFLNIFLKDK